MNELKLAGRFRWEIWSKPEQVHMLDTGRDKLFRHLLDKGSFPNGITTTALSAILDSYFNSTTPPTNWYLGLIDSTGFDELADADTMSSHAGWTENTDYAEATRPEWTAGAAASGILTNSAAIVFTASSDITITGLFVASNSTKGGTSGVLWSTGSFATEKNIGTGQTLKLYYELRARQG